MSQEVFLTIGMFGGLVLAIMSGVSLGFAMGGIAVIAGLIMWGPAGLMPIVAGVFNYMWMLLLAAVPLFIFIGVALSKSKIAEDMYETFYLWSGSLRGGLAVGSCGFAAALSAMTGNCSMRRKGYKDSIIFGTIGAAGTLGILIPPSITLIVIGMMTGQSIGKLFAGGLAAGLFILLGFIIYILLLSWLKPETCPAIDEFVSFRRKIRSLVSVILPVLIMLAILGTIFFGIATPTEAASVGAIAVVLAVILRGEFNWTFVKEVSYSTATITGMVLWIMFGASGFVAVYSGGGGVFFVQQLLSGTEMSPWTLFFMMNFFVFILGMFLDPMGIILLCLPIFYPIILSLGFDPIWFGIIFQVNLCMGYLTPPFGYNLFYLKSLAPEAEMKLIYKSVLPFIGIMLLCTLIMVIFPQIILFLPEILVK
jgi:tripartite ATP-independent transporter DctM subunit